ncbi:MAG: response regulator transcription factor [Bacteroidetes bacterium]|nr:response regulator transcription factor [Bacteroidota bacterium]
MNIVIIEDEQPARERLEALLNEIVPAANLLANHDSVQSAWKWFSENPMPDLVLLDVQLADGTAFDLLKLIKISCPIIFTTAFNKYAIEAFKSTSIDYLLKPVKKAELEKAFQKLNTLQHIFNQPEQLQVKLQQAGNYKRRFIVRFGDNLKTLPVENIAYCYTENRTSFAKTFDGHKYPLDYTLDALEKMMDPLDFFRINRQYLISVKSIAEMKVFNKARVIVKLTPEAKEIPVVSTERAADFKLWLSGELE